MVGGRPNTPGHGAEKYLNPGRRPRLQGGCPGFRVLPRYLSRYPHLIALRNDWLKRISDGRAWNFCFISRP